MKTLSLLSLLLLTACEPINSYLHLSNDGPIEEIGEAIIQSELGVSVDLSPETPE